MGNIFQVKRGAQVPSLGGLAPYELGFVINNIQDNTSEDGVQKNMDENAGYLYIGDLARVEGENLIYMPTKIKAGYADKAGSATSATYANKAGSATYAEEAGYAEGTSWAGYAEEADAAGFLIDINEGGLLSVGDSGEPVYFSDGIPVACGPVKEALGLSNFGSSIVINGDTDHSHIQIQTNGGPYSLSSTNKVWDYSLNHGVLTAPMLAVKTGNWGAGKKLNSWSPSGSYKPENGQLFFLVPGDSNNIIPQGWQQATVYVYMP